MRGIQSQNLRSGCWPSALDESGGADEALRCPKCGKVVQSLVCGHCGSQLAPWQADLYAAAIRKIAKLGGSRCGDSPAAGSPVAVDTADTKPEVEDDQPRDNGGASTPSWLFDRCSQLAVQACGAPITLDVAAADWNTKCERYYTKEQDGLKQPWDAKAAWCNPPYSATIIEDFVKKAIDAARAGTTTVCLVPRWNYPYLDLCEEHGRIHRICYPVGHTLLSPGGLRRRPRRWNIVTETTKPHLCDLLPPLLPGEYETLKASIADHGVEVPIIVDQDGNIIDGFHRQRASDELGVDCPREVRLFKSEEEKYELVLRLNCRRRQLNRKQKDALIEVYLRCDPRINDMHLADLIGVSQNTVAKVREGLIATFQIEKFAILRGRDGKDRPTKYKRIVANTAKESEAAMKAIRDLPQNCEGKTVDVVTAQRRARRNKKKEQRKVVAPFHHEAIKLFRCRFQELERLAGLKPSSVKLIQTDIPYHAEFLPQVSELAAVASRILAPGGLLVMQTGGLYVREIERRLDEHLTWQHPGVTVWRGDANMLFPIQCASQYKPVLIYSKGEWTPLGRWGDVSWVTHKEKKLHPHQQPLEDVEFWLRQFSEPDDLVVDVCAGSFTVAVACFRHGRRFVGCDCDESHVETGRQRLAAVVAGLPDPAADDSADEATPYRAHPPVRRTWGPAPARLLRVDTCGSATADGHE